MPLTLERRKYSRKPLAGLKIFSRNIGGLIGESINITSYGVLIWTENPLKAGTKIFLEFRLPGQVIPIKAYSDVKWTRHNPTLGAESSGMGVQFISMYEADRRKLEKYIGEECSKEKIDSDSLSLVDFIDIPNEDLFAKTRIFSEFINDTIQKGYNTYFRTLTSASKNRIMVLDRSTGKPKEMIMMGSNNYLGLATHPEVVKAVKEAIKKYGIGSGAASVLAGNFDAHKELEFKLAKMTSCEDAFLFLSGYITNVGCIQALLKKKDLAVVDRLAHASMLDGCVFSSGTFRTFKHSDVEDLQRVLEVNQDKYQGKLILVDGVYSMDGDIAPLPEIVKIAKEYGAKVMVDDAHATGVIGEKGRGSASFFKVEGEIDIVMSTFGKALGGLGGFVASSKEVIDYLRYYARPAFFSTNLPPAVAASALAAVRVMENEPEIIQNLWKNIKYMKDSLGSIGFNIGNTQSSIIPIIIGDNLTLRRMSKLIHEKGIYLNSIPYPAVPIGQERFRLSVMATHTKEDLDKALEVLEKVGKEFGVLGSDKPQVVSSTFAA